MFQKVLIANRGEIALRVIRACKELGIRTLAVYSEVDVDSLHVQLADESICIGAASSLDSYLRIDRIMSAAEIGDVDAIHPGYGFLAENPHFVEVCESCNIKFIGPSSRAMQSMGDKNAARAAARKAGVPITPGSDGIVETEDDAMKIAKKLGYPVMIKAAAGGGGRGMRAAHNEPSLKSAFHSARHEAQKAFGNDQVYLEKLILNPRHIEFQIMADSHGHIVHLGERDCSIQRRNQKVIEECPSPLMTPGLRKKMGNAAVKLAKSVGYENAGTIEFLVDQDKHFYFMEMNTRIKVEHTVARHPMPHQCRRSGQQFPGNAGPDRFLLCARRSRRSNRLTRLYRLHCAALLRLADCKNNYCRLDTDQCDRSNAPGVGRVLHHRHQNHGTVSCRHDAQRRFSRRKVRHWLDRASYFSGQAQLDHATHSFA